MMVYGNAFYDFNDDDTDIIFRDNPKKLPPGVGRIMLEDEYPSAHISLTGE